MTSPKAGIAQALPKAYTPHLVRFAFLFTNSFTFSGFTAAGGDV